MTVLYARAIGPYQASAPEAWSRMNAWLDSRHSRSRAKQGYGYFRDNPRTTAPDLLRFDACVPMTFGLEPDTEAGIGRQTLPGGAFAVYTHVGSYKEIGDMFSRLQGEIVPKRGLTLDHERPFVTIYLKWLREQGFPIPESAYSGTFRRYNGDVIERGQGEVLIWHPEA